MEEQSTEMRKQPLDRSLKRIMFGQCISRIGDSFTALALMWFIVQTGSATQVGINMALRYLPTLTLAPFIGAIVDRVSRKKLLWGSDLLRFFIDLLLILVIARGWFSIYIVYGYTLITAVIRQFYNPAQRAIIQSLSTAEQRVAANALQAVSLRTAMVAGPLLAGLAVKYLPTQGVVAVDAITFLIGSLIVMAVPLNENHIKKQRRENSYFKQMRDGLAYVGKRPWIIMLSCSYAFYNGGNSLEAVVRPFLVKDQLGLGVDTLGFIMSAGSLGALLISAALLRVKLKGHKLNYVILAILIRGAGVALLATAANFSMLAVFMFISTLPGPLLTINNNAFYQNEVPSEYMGRVFAVRSFVSTLAMPVGALFGATFMGFFGIRGSLIATGLIIMLGAGTAFMGKQSHDRMEKESEHNKLVAGMTDA